jgi:hypothetical protein
MAVHPLWIWKITINVANDWRSLRRGYGCSEAIYPRHQTRRSGAMFSAHQD